MADRLRLSNDSMEHEASVRQYALIWTFASGFYRWLAAKGLKLSGRRTGRMLDVACGPGMLPIAFARRAPGWRAVGLDISAPMIEEARRRVLAAKLADRVSIVEGSALEMPFEAESFDLVTMSNALHMIDDLDRLLSEIRRVMAPGGALLCQAYVRDPMPPYAALAWVNSRVLALLGSELEGMYWVFGASHTADEFRASVVENTDLTGDVRRRCGALLLAELRRQGGGQEENPQALSGVLQR